MIVTLLVARIGGGFRTMNSSGGRGGGLYVSGMVVDMFFVRFSVVVQALPTMWARGPVKTPSLLEKVSHTKSE